MSLEAVVAVTGHLQLQLLLAGEESVWLGLDQELPGEKKDQQDQHDCHSQPHCFPHCSLVVHGMVRLGAVTALTHTGYLNTNGTNDKDIVNVVLSGAANNRQQTDNLISISFYLFIPSTTPPPLPSPPFVIVYFIFIL